MLELGAPFNIFLMLEFKIKSNVEKADKLKILLLLGLIQIYKITYWRMITVAIIQIKEFKIPLEN